MQCIIKTSHKVSKLKKTKGKPPCMVEKTIPSSNFSLRKDALWPKKKRKDALSSHIFWRLPRVRALLHHYYRLSLTRRESVIDVKPGSTSWGYPRDVLLMQSAWCHDRCCDDVNNMLPWSVWWHNHCDREISGVTWLTWRSEAITFEVMMITVIGRDDEIYDYGWAFLRKYLLYH